LNSFLRVEIWFSVMTPVREEPCAAGVAEVHDVAARPIEAAASGIASRALTGRLKVSRIAVPPVESSIAPLRRPQRTHFQWKRHAGLPGARVVLLGAVL
jgi:hypothetical protein